jgi:hypothetical protein
VWQVDPASVLQDLWAAGLPCAYMGGAGKSKVSAWLLLERVAPASGHPVSMLSRGLAQPKTGLPWQPYKRVQRGNVQRVYTSYTVLSRLCCASLWTFALWTPVYTPSQKF